MGVLRDVIRVGRLFRDVIWVSGGVGVLSYVVWLSWVRWRCCLGGWGDWRCYFVEMFFGRVGVGGSGWGLLHGLVIPPPNVMR